MKKVLILGASGQIAIHVLEMLKASPDLVATLVVRTPAKLPAVLPPGAIVLEGDVMDRDFVAKAMSGQDIVYANLFGEMDAQAQVYLSLMKDEGIERLIHISTLGIYDEIPGAFGEWNNQMLGPYLPPYRRAADLIEASALDYLIIRPAWLSDNDEIDYEFTGARGPFKGTEVSRKSIAKIVYDAIKASAPLGRKNIGVNKPNTDADYPAFMEGVVSL